MASPTYSPFSGCLIGIIAISIVIVTICVGIWNLGKLDSAMQDFSEPTPHALASQTTQKITEEELASLIAPLNIQLTKLANTQASFENHEQVHTLSLTTKQAQGILASCSINAEVSQAFSLQAIQQGYMEVAVSLPIRNKPFSKEKFRYVNGIMIAELEIGKLQPTLKATSIKTQQGDVHPGFLKHFKYYEFAKHLIEHEQLKPIIPNITAIRITEDLLEFDINILAYQQLVTKLHPDAAKPVNTNAQRWFALSFLVIVLFGWFYIRNIGKAKNPLS